MSELKLQQLRTLAAERMAESTGHIQKIEHAKYIFWIFILVTAIFWFGITALRVSKKWEYMISNINKARNEGSTFDKSGFIVALSLEYPFLTSLRIANPHLPEAIQLSYYSSATSTQMGTGYDSTTKRDYLNELDLASQKCSPNTQGWCSAAAIWCEVFKTDPSGKPREDCFPMCNDPSYENQGLSYTTKMTGWGINFAFAGHVVGGAAGFGGAGLGIAGFVAGAALGAWQAYNTHQQQVQQCKSQRQHCYLPPGSPTC